MKTSVFALSLIAATSLAPLAAQADDDEQEAAAIAEQFKLISLDAAKAKALAAKPGIVIDADLDQRKFGKGWDYEFEIADANGQEWDVDIDAKTGALRNISRDWF